MLLRLFKKFCRSSVLLLSMAVVVGGGGAAAIASIRPRLARPASLVLHFQALVLPAKNRGKVNE
jgi:hypothetical protein